MSNLDLDQSILTLFNQYYPYIDHTILEKNVLAMLIENMFAIEKAKYSESESESDSELDSELELELELESESELELEPESGSESESIIEENYLKANEIIPGMIESGDLVSVRGRLNQIPVNILFDSGCQTSTTFTSIVKKADLESLVDKKATTYCNGLGGPTKTYGMIWCVDLELETEIETDNYISVPIKLSILDDSKNKKDNSDSNSDYEFDNKNPINVLIGTDFMKSSNVIIDFSKKLITLNDIELSYK